MEESEIEALYNEGADCQFMPDYITYPHYRRSALIIAIKNGHYNVLGTLMRLGADPFAKETYGKTFFDFFGDVSYSGCQEVINQLLPYVDKIGKELLFAVVGRGSFLVEQVRAVIEAGVDVNSLGENSSATPLLEACIARSTFIIDELVELGANVNEVYTGCVKRDKEEQDAGSLTILMAAALLGQERTVKLLLENGADVNFVNENGDNAITYLLKGSLNFRITGEFAFYNSFKNLDSYINIIELLLVSGLDLDHENNEGVSARMLIEEKFKTSKKLMNSIRKD